MHYIFKNLLKKEIDSCFYENSYYHIYELKNIKLILRKIFNNKYNNKIERVIINILSSTLIYLKNQNFGNFSFNLFNSIIKAKNSNWSYLWIILLFSYRN